MQIKGPKALVHWWYFPDSYHEWIPVSNIAGEPEEEENKEDGPQTVYRRWVRDSHLFNEWMNPVDYLPDEEGAEEEPEKQGKKQSKKQREDASKR